MRRDIGTRAGTKESLSVPLAHCGQKNVWNRCVEYWAICSSICSFARTAHSFACSALLATLARQLRSFYCSLAPSLIEVLMGESIMSTNWMRWFLTASTHIVMVYSRFLNKKLNRNKSSVVQTIRSRSDLYLFIILLLKSSSDSHTFLFQTRI